MSLLLLLRHETGAGLRRSAVGLRTTICITQLTPIVQRTLSTSRPQQHGDVSALQRHYSPNLVRMANVGLGSQIRMRPGRKITQSRGVATSAAATTTSAGVQFPPAASPVIEQVDWLHGFFLPYVRPLAPILDNLPTYIGLSEETPYAHVISLVVLTIVLRTAITLPVTLWQRARTRRLRDKFLPAMKEMQRTLPRQIVQQCRDKGMPGDEINKELNQQMRTRRKALMKEHRCAPLYTIAAAVGVNIPLFLITSFTIRTALMTKGLTIGEEVVPWWSPPAELSAKFEADARALAMRGMEPQVLADMIKIQGPTLSHVDKDMFTPVALGLTTFTNVELSQWQRKSLTEVANPTIASDQEEVNKRLSEAQQVAKASSEFRNRVIDNVLRTLAIGFVIVAAQAPSGLVIYWISSSVYTLVQTAIFAYVDQRQARSTVSKSLPPQPVLVTKQARRSR